MPRGGTREGAGRPLETGERAINGTLRLYPSTWARLEELCAATGMNKREVVSSALELLAKKTRGSK
jgi:hypothetical protein